LKFKLHIIKDSESEILLHQSNEFFRYYERHNEYQVWREKLRTTYGQSVSEMLQDDMRTAMRQMTTARIINSTYGNIVWSTGNTGTVTLGSEFGFAEDSASEVINNITVTRVNRTDRSITLDNESHRELAALTESERRQQQSEAQRERIEAERNRERRPWDRLTNFFR